MYNILITDIIYHIHTGIKKYSMNLAKYFLERYITRYNNQWYCHLCKLENLTDAKCHLQEVHPNIGIRISDFSHNLSNAKCKKLLNHGITIKNNLEDERCSTKYFCIPCKSSIPSLINVDEHLKEKKHRTCISSNSKLFNYGIITQDVLQNYNAEYFCIFCNCSIPTLDHVNEHLKGKKHQICKSDSKPELLNHGIIMEDFLQNCDVKYFCVPCNCSISALKNIDKHLQERKHQRYISSIKSSISNKQHSNENISDNVFINVKTQMEHINKSKFLAEMQPVCENKLTNDKSINGHKIKEEEDSITSSVSYQKDSNSNNVLQVERCVNMCFCSLCDKFDNKLNMSKHVRDKRHISAISALKINQEATYIIILENDRKTIKPLQLNSRKLDGTMWPEYIKTMSNVIICDRCNIPINETDIINHDITIHKEYMKSSMEYIFHSTLPINKKNVNIFNYYPMFKCSFCNEIIHGISMLKIHFSSFQHKENIKLLITTKKQEYNDCRNIESFFELLEFLNIISFENNDNIIQTMEQPVMYVKNRLASFHKNSDNLVENKFSYVCIACKNKFGGIQNVIEHLSTKKKHLKHFKNILLTYNHIYNICTIKELDINKTRAAESSICIENMSINTLEEHNINKIQTAQYIDNNSDLINTNTDSKNDILSQNRENNSGLFMPDHISIEIKQLIRNIPVGKNINNKIVRPKQTNNVLDRYNRMYHTIFLDFEKIMFTYNQDKLKEIESSLQLYALQNKNMLCLVCNVAHSINIHILYEHIRSEQHIIQLTQLHKNSEERRLNLLKESIQVNYTNFKCYACNRNEKWVHYGEAWIEEHIRYPTHKKKHKELIKNIERMLLSEEELYSLWYNIQYFACVECNARFKIKIEFMEHLYQKHENVFLNIKNSSEFDFCITCATLWYRNLSRCKKSVYQRHCEKRTHQYLKKSNDFAIMSLPQSLQELLKNINKTVAHLFKLSNDALNDKRTIQLVDDLTNAFETQQFDVEVYMFGSRVTGLASSESDIDIYLNFGKYICFIYIIFFTYTNRIIKNCL